MYLAPLNYDRFFKKVFSDKKIAQRFLEDFLDMEIEEFETLKERHYITDDASFVEFDFRCKIKGAYVVIDMQQWYKRDIGQRFYLYHALGTGLQLENLPLQQLVLNKRTEKQQKIKDYSLLEPVITLIWMAADTLEFKQDYVAYAMTPELVVDFIKNDRLWYEQEIVALLTERTKVLEVLQNDAKNLDFLPKNRLIFMLQKNIVTNKTIKKYEKWFEFAQKTLNTNNQKEDFFKFQGDEIFSEMMRRLSRDGLTSEDVAYIEEENKLWVEVERLETDFYNEGLKKGEKKGKEIGIMEGKEIGIIEGKEIGERTAIHNMAIKMIHSGINPEDVSKITGLTLEQVAEIMLKENM